MFLGRSLSILTALALATPSLHAASVTEIQEMAAGAATQMDQDLELAQEQVDEVRAAIANVESDIHASYIGMGVATVYLSQIALVNILSIKKILTGPGVPPMLNAFAVSIGAGMIIFTGAQIAALSQELEVLKLKLDIREAQLQQLQQLR